MRIPPSVPRPAWARHSPFPSALVTPPRHGAEPLLLALLALMVFTGAFVIIDIAYNAASLAAIGLFTLFGLRVDRTNIPLILFLVVFNLAGLAALQPYLDVQESREFMLGTCFVATTAIFFAFTLNENALARLAAIKWGMIAGAVIAALLGIAGYVDLFGSAAWFTMHGGRVSGTFRDPNVLGPFLVLPILFLAQDFLTSPRGRLLRAGLAAPILLALFLTFSRGAWAGLAIGLATLGTMMFITSRSASMRGRILLLGLLALFGLGLGLAAILSIDSVAALFEDRFTLQKDYDSGPSGRFGSQLRALPDLLERPFGHGPNRFSYYYPENPHNTYLMAFSSYGWAGGITFLAFILATLTLAFRTALLKTPFQPHAVVLFAALVPHLVQNFQIDTDRWRHLFMIYGLCWGLATISRRWIGEYRTYAHAAYRAAAARVAAPAPAPSPASSPA
ncbi:O-antigen ligase family protein [Rhabdaerophilum calidifontis]|uniref:O-antigen ligase family protein n=1 Tax=Rhabdaerophilum calidifontis TaxID=2604328 RepID=UPI0012392736|nr:O-antigen ligase family protein [Rhabdaerophilum calidifontis]